MKLSYQVATPDVRPSWGVTAYQGELEKSFQVLREHGYDGVELMVARPSQVDAAEIQRLSAAYRLPVSMVCTGELFGQEGLSFSVADEAVRQEAIRETKAAILLARAVGADCINVGRLRGGLTMKGDWEAEKQRSLDGLREAARFGAGEGVYVLLEPVNSIAATFINSTEDGLRVIEEMGEPFLRLMLDSNHMYLDDKDIFHSIEKAREVVRFVHLADSNRLYPGNCKFDFPAFIKALTAVGYDGWYSVEAFQRPDQDTVLKASIDYLRSLEVDDAAD